MDPFEAEIAALQQRRTTALWRQTEGLCIAELEAMPPRLLSRLYRRYAKRRAAWLAHQEWIRQAAITLGLASQPDVDTLAARVVSGLVDGSERKQELS